MIRNLTFSLMLLIAGCGLSNKEKASETFNEGIKLSVEAEKAMVASEFEKAAELNQKAMDKLEETIRLDPEHQGAPAALGHICYISKDFDSAVKWYEKAIERDSTSAANYLGLGLARLSKISTEQMSKGKGNIDLALAKDSGPEVRKWAKNELIKIGTTAFQYGTNYLNQGAVEQGIRCQSYALNVLKMAHGLDSSDYKLIGILSEFHKQSGDTTQALFYQEKLDELKTPVVPAP